MRAKYLVGTGTAAGLAIAGAYLLRQNTRARVQWQSARTQTQSARALARAAPLIRLPTSPGQPPEVLGDGSGLRCPITDRVYPYRNGVLDLLDSDVRLTATQHTLNTPTTAWAYDRSRDALLRLFGLPDFPEEVAMIQEALRLWPGDTMLDLACGHGNFTVEWAKRVGPDGLVIALDLSPAMLMRAAERVNRWGLDNVLLIRGDAHQLPLADSCIRKVNCSGGFHQFPDLPQALREIARVSAPAATLTASTFAESPDDQPSRIKRWLKQRFTLHFVPLDQLGEQLVALGYGDYAWSLPGGWFGYASAKKRSGHLVG
jgi:ubiquinone/menaquinone biosynthesis C-methylase UbiE